MSKALILIDIQNDYFENGANTLIGSETASENARLLLNEFRKKQLPVIHIQHLSLRAGSTFFIPHTIGAEIHANVAPMDNEKVFAKHSPNSFIETGLHEYLSALHVSELVICGMMTHMCVDATIRAAKDFGYICTLIGDACATKNLQINGLQVAAQDVQNSFLAALNYFYADVTTVQDYLA
ncbi:MAG TPA: cysteine hydrolase family protein [Paludibacter sp.]